jgi:AcrR family transcriptional regulator
MKNNRQTQKEQTRQRLLEVAQIEFAQRGILATRMSDIAAAAQVSHGTVFAHFATQELLTVAVIQEFGERMARRTHELAGSSARLRDVLAAHLTGIQEYEGLYTRLVLEGRALPQPARDTLISIQSAISVHISQAAERDMQAGLTKVMPLPLLFNTWVGLVHYYLANADLFAPGESVIQRYGPILLEHYMSLISVP